MGQVSKDSTSGAWGISRGDHACFSSNDASFFSTSLPVLPHEKLLQNFNGSENCGQSLGDGFPNIDKLEDDELNIVGNVLPDDEDELLAGITDDFNLSGLRSQLDDLEECDLFGPGGGMELDFEQESLRTSRSELNISDGITANGMGHFVHPNGVGAVVGEHPYGEHPSRTLFVRNINSNVEDYELRSIFEQYGDIRTLYTACKHRGFVMISYYDIRDARTAMRALQNKPLRRRKLDIHFSIPKDNPSEKDTNQGTLVVFNLDASVSNDDLRQIFGAYGEVKEIRETPHKRHHKFIEFYDVRAAEAALIALNKSDIAGKRIKLEPSRPGGARRSLVVQQLSQELEHDETRSFRHQVGSPMGNSPPGTWAQFGSPVERSPLLSFSKSPVLATINSVNGNSLAGLASILPLRVSNPSKNAPIGKDQRIAIPDNGAFQHSHSFHDQKLSTSPVPISAFRESNSNSSGIGTLSAPQFLWGSPTPHSSSSPGATSLGHAFTSTVHTTHHGSLLGSYHHHHVGSAPSGVPFNGHFGSPETSFVTPVAYGGMGLTQSTASYMNMAPRAAVSSAIGHPGWMTEKGSPSFQMMSLPRKNPVFPGNGYHSVPGTYNWFAEQSPNRRVENIQQFHLDLDKIISGEDARTSLMIKNIPNKYTAKMLMATIDENHSGTYDFLYLLIDFKNRCNLGYAFINMVSPSHIIPFYKEFNGKKWEKFNSEKVASLAYARLQGKAALAAHFQNSSLMNEDKQCRPILFKSQGQEIDDQEHFLSRNVNIVIRQPDGSYSGDSLDSPKGSPDE